MVFCICVRNFISPLLLFDFDLKLGSSFKLRPWGWCVVDSYILKHKLKRDNLELKFMCQIYVCNYRLKIKYAIGCSIDIMKPFLI